MNEPSKDIDLNADLGEGCPHDAALLACVTSASICCGAYAGDRASILETLKAAKQQGVVVGAHPGFPDRAHFGRRERPISLGETERLILEQVQDLNALAVEADVILRFVKPHGALYNQAQREVQVADGVVAALARLGLPVLGQPGSVLQEAARASGVRFVAEGFPERRYRPDGRLVGRSEPGAVLLDPVAIGAQALQLYSQGVRTLCVHGDDPRAVENADTIRSAFMRHNVALKSFA